MNNIPLIVTVTTSIAVCVGIAFLGKWFDGTEPVDMPATVPTPLPAEVTPEPVLEPIEVTPEPVPVPVEVTPVPVPATSIPLPREVSRQSFVGGGEDSSSDSDSDTESSSSEEENEPVVGTILYADS